MVNGVFLLSASNTCRFRHFLLGHPLATLGIPIDHEHKVQLVNHSELAAATHALRRPSSNILTLGLKGISKILSSQQQASQGPTRKYDVHNLNCNLPGSGDARRAFLANFCFIVSSGPSCAVDEEQDPELILLHQELPLYSGMPPYMCIYMQYQQLHMQV